MLTVGAKYVTVSKNVATVLEQWLDGKFLVHIQLQYGSIEMLYDSLGRPVNKNNEYALLLSTSQKTEQVVH